MARYDLYPNAEDDSYFLDIQSDFLGHLNTRIVVPLLPANIAPTPGRRLNPNFVIAGKSYVMVTQFMSALSATELRESQGNLHHHHDDIVAALDMLFHGF